MHVTIYIIKLFCPRTGFQYKLRKQGSSSVQRQVFHWNPGTNVAVLLGMNRCDRFPLLSAHHSLSLFIIWTDLKRSENIPGAPTWGWEEWIWQTGPSWLNRNSQQMLNISSIRVFDQIRDPEIPIILRPLKINLENIISKASRPGPSKLMYGPRALSDRLFCGPPQPNNFVIFLVCLLVTRINCLVRFKYEWGCTKVIRWKCKAKQYLRNIRCSLYILVQERVVKLCDSLLVLQVHRNQLSRTSLAGRLSLRILKHSRLFHCFV